MATGGVFVHVDVIQESVHAVCSSSKPVKMGYITDLCRSVCVCVYVSEREKRERELSPLSLLTMCICHYKMIYLF